MGWFWGASGDKDRKDALEDLDPQLQEFLKRESPVKYEASGPRAPIPKPSIPAPKKEDDISKANVPPQSLYQDGRYAHLWKTYRPQAEVEQEGKSEQEKMQDLLEGYQYRKAEIGRVALENCALEQIEVNECFMKGGVAARMTMCRAENRKFERCYTMQAKFLKALGYLDTFDRPPEVDEQIQMHADTLYHRMLAQEKVIEQAKAEGKPVPSFPPLLSSKPKLGATENKQTGNQLEISDLSKKVQGTLSKKLDTLEGEEREIEERAIKQELEAGKQLADRLSVIDRVKQEERRKRKEEGKETLSDKLYSMFRQGK